MNRSPLIVEGLGHAYPPERRGEPARPVLQGIDLELGRGELLAVVGPSGAGKSTLLRCIAGLIEPAEGRVEAAGRPAVVFQEYARSLYPWMTVERNTAFPLSGLGLSREERDRRVRTGLERVGLEDAAGQYPGRLSGGMQQRVAIARALAFRPAILLMDEPFASVDALTRAELEDLVLEIRAELGMSILFITHDIDESVYLADRVIVLSAHPASVAAEIPVPLPYPRDQIATKESPEFVRRRAEVARALRAAGEDARARRRAGAGW
ncbi:ABC transporter ATP-binding protein [Gulosibacter sp. 10]|uniref:ABC transporter ATP-binding protein n=1 Tax=Gulosibacter sp. 10 TaxID=1255570 RepID=UPI00097EC6CF|nr:ABC transporter ATP-binding protein [Gulosibacter sp. 10]SJM54548.1 ABC transporter related [Gulosibacter sp. 10]